MKECKNCNNQLKDDEIFCGICGTKVITDDRVNKAVENDEIPNHQHSLQENNYQQQPTQRSNIQQPYQQQLSPEQQPFQQPMQQGYPQQQPFQQPMQQGYPQQQSFQQPMQQGYPQQQPFQQPMQQGYPQQQSYLQQQSMQSSPVAPGTPVIRFIWPKTQSHIILFTFIPWLNKLNVAINGVTLTPFNGIKF